MNGCMNKKELLFYDAYEAFYAMAKESTAFQAFCKDAFGEDFSQDGFSDRAQVDLILPYIPQGDDVHILDIGCGNGKMLGYLQKKTNAYIHGFDYSAEAIAAARMLTPENAEFREGIIGKIEYPKGAFDVVISMDTMYFAPDMIAFVAQVKEWLKDDGVFFVGYQEGDVVPKTRDAHTTLLAQALRANKMAYEVTDISRQSYAVLKTKRGAALKHRSMFAAEGRSSWCDMIIGQTEYANVPFEEFRENMARYIYVIRK